MSKRTSTSVVRTALFCCLLLASAGGLRAQQTANFGQYYANPFLINPSAAGAHPYAEIMAVYRRQWTGIEGAPTTQALTLETPLRNQAMGLGLYLYNDVSNILGQTGVLAAYRYTALLSQHHRLSFGLALGVSDKRIYFNKIRAEDPFEQSLLRNQESRTALDGSFGITYQFKKAELGFSTQQIFGNQLEFAHASDERVASFNLIRHYYLTAAYQFMLNELLTLDPYILLKSAQGLPFQLDINAITRYRRNHWLGISYRHQSSVGVSLGTLLDDQFTLSYGYELPTNALAGYGGSHECTLGFRFSKSNREEGGSKSNRYGTSTEQIMTDNRKQYELIDQLQQDNESLRKKVTENQKTISQQREEVDRLMNTIKDQQEEVNRAIRTLQENVPTVDTTSTTGAYFAVVGAFKTLKYAKQYQKIIKRELQMVSSVVQSQRVSGVDYFFVYTQRYDHLSEALQETRRLNTLETKGLIVGNPWVYRKSQ